MKNETSVLVVDANWKELDRLLCHPKFKIAKTVSSDNAVEILFPTQIMADRFLHEVETKNWLAYRY